MALAKYSITETENPAILLNFLMNLSPWIDNLAHVELLNEALYTEAVGYQH